MDPDVNIREQIELARAIIASLDMDLLAMSTIQTEIVIERANSLAELVLALDRWIGKGGFLPARWNV